MVEGKNKGVLPDLWDAERNLIKKAQQYGCTIRELKYWMETGKKLIRSDDNERATTGD